MKVDRIVHEPVRLRILSMLSALETVDFNFLRTTLALTNGNLSSHIDSLERAGYVGVRKSFRGKLPHTEYRLTRKGRRALKDYWSVLDEIRGEEARG